MPKFDKKYAVLLTAIFMGFIMAFFVTFVITLVNFSGQNDFFLIWIRNFAIAYVVVVPLIVFFLPKVRQTVANLIAA